MAVNHDRGFVVSIWKSVNMKVSLVWMIVQLMVLRRIVHKASFPLSYCTEIANIYLQVINTDWGQSSIIQKRPDLFTKGQAYVGW